MSTIIKATGQRRNELGSSVQQVAFNFDDMTQQAQKYLAEIRAQAAKIINEAQEQAKTIRKQAEQQGQQAAMQAVERVMEEKVGAHIKTLLPALQQAVGQIEHARQEWLAHWQSASIQLSCAIAGRIVRRELQHVPEITLDWITEALQMAAGSADLTIHMNPTDLEHLGQHVDELTKQINPLAPARVVPNPAISLGGCRIESRFGSIDQQLETQLQRITEELGK